MEHQLPVVARFGLIILACCALLPGCRTEVPETSETGGGEKAEATWPASLKTAGGTYSVTLNPIGGEILENKHFALNLTIDAQGADPASLKVKVDADMPAHEHGMNTQPELSDKGPLHYQVDGMLFHMAGEWVIMVDVTRDGKTERASFPVQVE